MISPFTSNVLFWFVFNIPNLLSDQYKLLVWCIARLPFPINICPNVKLFLYVPPLIIFKVPEKFLILILVTEFDVKFWGK